MRFVLDVLGLPGDLETTAKYLLAFFGLSAVTGGWAVVYDSVHWGIFTAAGVFCFCVLSYVLILGLRTNYSLKHKLILTGSHVALVDLTDDPERVQVRAGFTIKNVAQFPIYFTVEELECSFGGGTEQHDRTTKQRGRLGPGDEQSFLTAMFNCQREAANGRLKICVTYGRERDAPMCKWEETIELIPVGIPPPSQRGMYTILRNEVESSCVELVRP